MEMRATRLGERFFLPWDPLQLSDLTDSGKRVRKNSVIFEVFRTYRKHLLWTPLQDNNFAMLGAEKDQVVDFIRIMGRKATKSFKESVEIAFYDLDGTWEEPLLPLDDSYSVITYHPYKEPLLHWCNSVIKHRQLLRDKTGGKEAPNKVLQFLLIHLNKEAAKTLQGNAMLVQMMSSLLKSSEKERLYLGVFADDPRDLPKRLLPDFSQVYFMGEVGREYASEVLYPDSPITANSFQQELVGFGKFSQREELVSLHPSIFTQSEWGKKYEAAKAKEEELYRKYLESLEDGS